MTTSYIAGGPTTSGNVPSDHVVAICERSGRQLDGGGVTTSATAEATRAGTWTGAAAGLPGLPGTLPAGGLTQYSVN